MRAPGSRQAAALRRGKGFSGHWDQDQVRDRDQAMETETFAYPGHSAALRYGGSAAVRAQRAPPRPPQSSRALAVPLWELSFPLPALMFLWSRARSEDKPSVSLSWPPEGRAGVLVSGSITQC